MIARKILTYFSLLGIFISLGYWGGRATSVKAREYISNLASVERDGKQLDYPLPTNMMPGPSQEADQGEITFRGERTTIPMQKNILVIGVTDLTSPEPELESVWMVLYLTDNTHLTLMPIYPSFVPDFSQTDLLVRSFQLNEGRSPETEFIKVLQDQNLWWNYTVVIDQVALNAVVEFMLASGTGGVNLNSVGIDQTLIDQNTLTGQTLLLQGLCYAAGELPYLPDVSSLYKLIPSHVMTDLPLVEFISSWQIRLAQGSQLSCEFPFLNSP